MTKSEALETIARQGWLSLTPMRFREAVLQACRLEEFPADEWVFQASDAASGIYGLAAGGVAVVLASGDAEPRLAYTLLPGHWIGAAAAMMHVPRRVGLKCMKPSRLLYLPVSKIDAIIMRDSDAWRFFSQIAFENAEAAVGVAEDLLIRDSTQRCAAAVLRIVGCRYECGGREPLEIDVSQDDIARMSNLSRNATGAILRTLEQRRLIELSYRKIKVRDAPGLRALVARSDSSR